MADEQEAPRLNDNFSNVIVVDNIPVVDMSKFQKLSNLIYKEFSNYGKIVQEGFHIPCEGEPQKTLGYAFIEYETPEQAAFAVAKADHKKLDNKHTYRVNLFDDVDKFRDVKEEYVPAQQSEYDIKANLQGWLSDTRDQFVLRFGADTEVFWHDPVLRGPGENFRQLKYGGEREKERGKNWTEMCVGWSPKGAYLATFHQQGIVLWGGDDFDKLGRFSHPGVKVIDFSPNEKYLVTSSGEDALRKDDPECIIVWDIRSGKKLRGFKKGEVSTWPVFKWSFDDRYLARVGENCISVYETPTMGLLGKKSIPVPGVREVAWSPDQHLMSYWVPEMGNAPARVALVECPSRKLVREKHLFNVVGVTMHWQQAGDYLCVKLVRQKTKTKTSTNFEIFRLKAKDIPIEVIEIDANIVAFAWEPRGHRFGVIHGDLPRPNVSFYTLRESVNKVSKIKKLHQFDSRAANCLFWAPAGGTCVLAGLNAMNGQLEFVDVDHLDSMGEKEHFRCTDVEWDPSGRFLLTAVSQPLLGGGGANWRTEENNGYRVWSFQGDLLCNVAVDELYQVLWRPRPPTLMSKAELKTLRDTLKSKYWSQFEAQDAADDNRYASKEMRLKKLNRVEWRAYRMEKDEEYRLEAEERAKLRNGMLSDDENDYLETEQIVEEEISREEEVVQE